MKTAKILSLFLLLFYSKIYSQIKSDTIVVVLPNGFNINKLGSKIKFYDFYFRNDTMFYPNLKYTIKDTGLYRQNALNIAHCTATQFKFIDKSKRKIALTKWSFEKFFGDYYQYYKNGNLCTTGKYSASLARTKIDNWKYYYPTGKIKKEEYYTSEGVKAGVWKIYNKKGKLIKEKIYSK